MFRWHNTTIVREKVRTESWNTAGKVKSFLLCPHCTWYFLISNSVKRTVWATKWNLSKRNFCPCTSHEAIGGSRGRGPLTHNLGTEWWVVILLMRPTYMWISGHVVHYWISWTPLTWPRGNVHSSGESSVLFSVKRGLSYFFKIYLFVTSEL
jgi:hypothetical protein